MKIILASIIIFLSSIVIVNGSDTGSLFISKIDAQKSWEGNPTGATAETVFTVTVNGKTKVQISKDKDAKISNLELGKKHSVIIFQDGKRIESFHFKFEDYRCDRLWLYYKNLYGTWILRESNWSCKR
jgi:hypothetical protein